MKCQCTKNSSDYFTPSFASVISDPEKICQLGSLTLVAFVAFKAAAEIEFGSRKYNDLCKRVHALELLEKETISLESEDQCRCIEHTHLENGQKKKDVLKVFSDEKALLAKNISHLNCVAISIGVFTLGSLLFPPLIAGSLFAYGKAFSSLLLSKAETEEIFDFHLKNELFQAAKPQLKHDGSQQIITKDFESKVVTANLLSWKHASSTKGQTITWENKDTLYNNTLKPGVFGTLLGSLPLILRSIQQGKLAAFKPLSQGLKITLGFSILLMSLKLLYDIKALWKRQHEVFHHL